MQVRRGDADGGGDAADGVMCPALGTRLPWGRRQAGPVAGGLLYRGLLPWALMSRSGRERPAGGVCVCVCVYVCAGRVDASVALLRFPQGAMQG